jgi:hypothetical protein
VLNQFAPTSTGFYPLLSAALAGSAKASTRILGCFPENHKVGSGGGHALGFEQYVAEVFIPTAAA